MKWLLDTFHHSIILEQFVKNRGNKMTVSIANREVLKNIYNLSEKVRTKTKSPDVLNPYAPLSVRVGGMECTFCNI